MNAPHIHLIVNHLSVIGVPLAVITIGWGLWRASRELLRFGLGAGVLFSVLTYPVYLSGEPAEEYVESMSWADEANIEPHEERAELALIVVLLAGAIAAFGLWQIRGENKGKTGFIVASLAALALASGMLWWTALEGGQIRHDEIRNNQPGVAEQRGAIPDHDEDDDEEHDGRHDWE